MDITISGDAAVDQALKEYPGRATKAMVRAMNRAITSGRTIMVREIANDTGLSSGAVRKAFKLREATLSSPEARLATSLKRIPLIEFKAKGPEPSRGRGRGVSYKLAGSRGRHPHAFIARMKSGHRGVFVRSGKARLGIRELFGPSLGRVFAKFRPVGIARIREAFVKNFAHEMGWQQAQDAGAD